MTQTGRHRVRAPLGPAPNRLSGATDVASDGLIAVNLLRFATTRSPAACRPCGTSGTNRRRRDPRHLYELHDSLYGCSTLFHSTAYYSASIETRRSSCKWCPQFAARTSHLRNHNSIAYRGSIGTQRRHRPPDRVPRGGRSATPRRPAVGPSAKEGAPRPHARLTELRPPWWLRYRHPVSAGRPAPTSARPGVDRDGLRIRRGQSRLCSSWGGRGAVTVRCAVCRRRGPDARRSVRAPHRGVSPSNAPAAWFLKQPVTAAMSRARNRPECCISAAAF